MFSAIASPVAVMLTCGLVALTFSFETSSPLKTSATQDNKSFGKTLRHVDSEVEEANATIMTHDGAADGGSSRRNVLTKYILNTTRARRHAQIVPQVDETNGAADGERPQRKVLTTYKLNATTARRHAQQPEVDETNGAADGERARKTC